MFILAQRASLDQPNLVAYMALFIFVMRLEPSDAPNDLSVFGMAREAFHDDDNGLVHLVADYLTDHFSSMRVMSLG
jgi:hypothetical protein